MNQNSKLPPIRQLFQNSWHTFTESLLSLLLLNILGIIVYIGLGIIAVLIIVISGIGSYLMKFFLQGATNLPVIPLSTYYILGITAVIFALILILVGSALQIASILLVDSKGKLPVIGTFKRSFKLVIPLFLAGLLSFILTFGALFVFVLPAILFVLLLMFVQFEVILNNQKWTESIKRSVLIVKSNFGAVFIRLLLLWLLYFGIFIIISILQNIAGESAQWAISIFSSLLNLLLGWFALAYLVNLYKHASMKLKQEKGKGITWMWIVTLIGWLIALGVFFTGYKVITSGILNSEPIKNIPVQPTASPSLLQVNLINFRKSV